jgi:hypothetical protein
MRLNWDARSRYRSAPEALAGGAWESGNAVLGNFIMLLMDIPGKHLNGERSGGRERQGFPVTDTG